MEERKLNCLPTATVKNEKPISRLLNPHSQLYKDCEELLISGFTNAQASSALMLKGPAPTVVIRFFIFSHGQNICNLMDSWGILQMRLLATLEQPDGYCETE